MITFPPQQAKNGLAGVSGPAWIIPSTARDLVSLICVESKLGLNKLM
jgi:hypothetical protein